MFFINLSYAKEVLLRIIIGFLFALFISVDIYAEVGVCTTREIEEDICWEADVDMSQHQGCPDWQDERVCYIEIPLEIGEGATFNNKMADANGIVKAKMYYKDYQCNDGTVFAHDYDMYPGWDFCPGYYEKVGQYKPTKNGYVFDHWELYNTCSNTGPIVYDYQNTDLVPVFRTPGSYDLCNKIVAVWVCPQGYYGNATDGCTKCPDGKTTASAGATSETECKQAFGYGDSGEFWMWPDNVEIVQPSE